MCNKAVDTGPVCIFFLFLINISSKKCVTNLFPKILSKRSKFPKMLKYCLDRYKIQEMCDKATDAFLSTLKFAPDWFVTNKKIKNLDDDHC